MSREEGRGSSVAGEEVDRSVCVAAGRKVASDSEGSSMASCGWVAVTMTSTGSPSTISVTMTVSTCETISGVGAAAGAQAARTTSQKMER